MSSYTDFATKFTEYIMHNQEYRRGQAFLIALNECYPELAERLRLEGPNPFHDDAKLREAMMWVTERWPFEGAPEPDADGYTYTVVYEAGHWSYDWQVVAVFKRSDGAFAVVSQSGCSCDSWEGLKNAPDAEYTHDLSELHRRFRKGLGDGYTFSVAAAFEHMDAMRKAVKDA